MRRLVPSIAPRLMFGFAFVFIVLLALPVTASGIASPEEALKEKFHGKADAPVTIIEYASLGCPHCAAFHAQTFPLLKKDYVDTGKVKFIYRDFPLGTPAFAASMVARCAGHTRYFGMVDMLFKSQAQWSRAENPLVELQKVARFGGMAPADVEACLRSKEIQDGIRKAAQEGQDLGVNSTPSFVIGGKVHAGNMTYEDFKKLIDAALKGN